MLLSDLYYNFLINVQIKRALVDAGGKLQNLEGEAEIMAEKNRKVKEEYKKNKEKLLDAEKKYGDAKEKADEVTNVSNSLINIICYTIF